MTCKFIIKINNVKDTVHQLAIKDFLDKSEIPHFAVIKPNKLPYCKLIFTCKLEAMLACEDLQANISGLQQLLGSSIRMREPALATREDLKLLQN